MKYLAVIAAVVLIAAQAWGVEGKDAAYNNKYYDAKLDFFACASEYNLSILQGEVDTGFAKITGSDPVPLHKSTQLEICEAKLDEYIKQAANGDDATYDGLISVIGDMAAATNVDNNKRTFAKKYERKLEMAQQRAMLKAKTAPEKETIAKKKKRKKQTDRE